jgi:hypothetical protein
MWPPLLLAVALGMGHAHQLGEASLHLRLPVGPTHRSAFAGALSSHSHIAGALRSHSHIAGALRSHSHTPRSSRVRLAGFGACRSARTTILMRKAAPREITSYLTRATSLSAILDVYKRHGSSFDAINVATAWNRLGKARATGRERAGFFRGEERTLLQLLQHVERVSFRLEARNIAGACYGMARLRFEPAAVTISLLGAGAMPRLGEFEPQNLANTVWAFATLGVPAPQLFDAIALDSVQRIGNFKPQELANTAWAFATLGVLAPQLFEAIARESEQRIGSFIPQGLANTAWAFATLGVPATQLFEAIARESEQHIGSFKTQGLANTAWAFATLGTPAPQLRRDRARERAEHRQLHSAGPCQHRVGVCQARRACTSAL